MVIYDIGYEVELILNITSLESQCSHLEINGGAMARLSVKYHKIQEEIDDCKERLMLLAQGKSKVEIDDIMASKAAEKAMVVQEPKQAIIHVQAVQEPEDPSLVAASMIMPA